MRPPVAVLLAVLVPATAFARPTFLDPTFGTGGIVQVDGIRALGAVRQPDGRLVIGGDGTFALARVDADGVLDASFGTGGLVANDFSVGANGIALQADGRILRAGRSGGAFGVVRHEVDGALDLTFGSGGLAIADLSAELDEAARVVVQPDDKIVVAGRVGQTGTSQGFGFARFNPDGSLDPTFGDGGLVVADLEGDDTRLNAVALQPDGSIVAAGRTHLQHEVIALLRLHADGTVDAGFGEGGGATIDLPRSRDDEIFALGLDLSGRVLGVGLSFLNGADDFVVVRVLTDGRLDETFGDGGFVRTDFAGRQDQAFALAVQPDGKIVVGGRTDSEGGAFLLVRYHDDGARDASFGTCGLVATDFGDGGTALQEAQGIVLLDDGRVILAGSTSGSSWLTRYVSPTPPRCAESPLSSCKTSTRPGRAKLVLKKGSGSRQNKLAWSWHRGEETTLAELGDPFTSDDYSLCGYDESGVAPQLVLAATARAGGICGPGSLDGPPCWRAAGNPPGAKVIFKDRRRELCGLTSLRLKAGEEGRTSLLVQGKGAHLPLPELPLDLPLTVQLQGDHGACWEARYVEAERNDADQFKARSE